MAEQKKRLGEMLIDDGLITREQLEHVLELQKKEPSGKIGEILVKEKIIEKEVLMKYLVGQID
jgi:hypothetical protein